MPESKIVTEPVEVITTSTKLPYTLDEQEDIKTQFLIDYCKYGSIHKASSSCGVSSSTIRRWLDNDEEFHDNFEKMRDIFVGKLELMALQRAEESDSLLAMLLRANAPEKYNPRPSQTETSNAPIVVQFNTAIFNPKEVEMIGKASSTPENSEGTR